MSRLVTLFQNQIIRASDHVLQPGVEVLAASSVPQGNSSGNIYNSLRVDLTYKDLAPNQGQFFIGAIVEGKDAAGNWAPIAYQFSPLRDGDTALQRILVAQPNMDTFNLGIDDVVYPVDREVARISRTQAQLPETEFRVCISLQDNDPSGPNAFVEVTVDGTAELYNV